MSRLDATRFEHGFSRPDYGCHKGEMQGRIRIDICHNPQRKDRIEREA